MPRNLYLLRHAQAAETQQGQQDYDRHLTSHGLREAAAIAKYLKKNNISIELIISSSAIRAYTTAKTISEGLNLETDIIQSKEVYHGSLKTLLDVLNQQSDEYKSILLVGHNPYISYFAEFLTKENIGDLSTAGLVMIKFDIANWSDIAEGNGLFEAYIDNTLIDAQ
ncbi:MAG: phosphohistidine phosphatase SixA [Cyclobacteriaceae bacterium]